MKNAWVPAEGEEQPTASGEEQEAKAVPEPPRRNENEDFQTLYEESFKTLEDGQILKGTVMDITPDHVTVDVGYKCEGQIPIQEFLRKDRKIDVKVGDRIDVLVERKNQE